MKRRFANSANNGNHEYIQKRIDTDDFKGYVCFLKMKNVTRPLKVKDGDFIACLLDENYIWLEVYPDNENYAITIMYDDKNNLIEWYFDIAKEVGIENGVPYEDDLYLDMLIKPNGEEIVLDEDELKLALDTNQINQNDYELAYRTLEKIKKIYLNNFEYLKNFTSKLYEVFKV